MKNQKAIAFIAIIAAIILLFQALKKRKEVALYLTLNEKGIGTFNYAFISWEEISGEKIIRGKVDDNDDFYLVLNTTSGEERIGIDRLSVRPEELLDLLKIYRHRFEERQKQQLED